MIVMCEKVTQNKLTVTIVAIQVLTSLLLQPYIQNNFRLWDVWLQPQAAGFLHLGLCSWIATTEEFGRLIGLQN